VADGGGDHRRRRYPSGSSDLAPAATVHSEEDKGKAASRSLPDWHQPDRHRFDRADCQELDGIAGFDAAAFAGHSLRRGAISSGVAAGVHIARLKQFSGHASLKSLEEYVELDELRQNHPLKDVL
jgi:hypothetical protein